MSSIKPNGDRGQIDCGEEVSGTFVVARGDGSELLELAEEIFDEMPSFVEFFIILTRRRAVALRRDDGDLIGGGKRFDHAGIGIERLVGDHDVGDDQRQKRVSTRQVMRLSRGEQEPDRVAERVDQRVDLRAQPAFAAPDRFVCAVFFGAPALCW